MRPQADTVSQHFPGEEYSACDQEVHIQLAGWWELIYQALHWPGINTSLFLWSHDLKYSFDNKIEFSRSLNTRKVDDLYKRQAFYHWKKLPLLEY